MTAFDMFSEGDLIVVLFLLVTSVLGLIFAVVYCWSDRHDIDDLDRQYRDEDGDHYYYDHTRIGMKRHRK